MSLFSGFSFRSKRPINGNSSENICKTTAFTTNVETSGRLPVFTPQQRSLLTIDSTKSSQSATNKAVFTIPQPLSQKSRSIDGLTPEATVEEISDDSAALKQRVADELERIETWKELMQMEANKRLEEISTQKTLIDELNNKMIELNNKNNRLESQIANEISEREEVMTKMANTRQMFIRLKDNIEGIERRFDGFTEIKECVEIVNENRRKQYQELAERFHRLDINHKYISSDYQNKLSVKANEVIDLKERLKKINEEYNHLQTESTNKIINLNSEINRCQQREDNLKALMAEKESQNASLISKIDILEQELQQLKTILEDKQKTNEELTDQIKTIGNQLNDIENKCTEVTEELTEMKSKHELSVETIRQMNEEQEVMRETHESYSKTYENEIKSFEEMVKNLETKVNDLEITNNTKEEEKSALESILKQEIDVRTHEIDDLMTQKNCLTEEIKKINESLRSITAQKQELEEITLTEKQSLISDYENTIKEMTTNIEQNVSRIEELENNANQSFCEKETIKQQLTQELDQLKKQLEDFSAKISELENKLKEKDFINNNNMSSIHEMSSEIEVLKTEKYNLENRLQREESNYEMQMSNISTILESCKSDYNKRIDDKEERIVELKRELERMRHSNKYLNDKCERLEQEKQSTAVKLQEMTMSAMRPINSSPNRCLTPKFMSPIESTRLSAHRTSSPIIQRFSDSLAQKLDQSDNEDVALSAKQELEKTLKKKNENLSTKSAESQMTYKPKERKTFKKTFNLNDETKSTDSVYEFLSEDNRLKKMKKSQKGFQTIDGQKHRIDSPLRVKMNLVDKLEDIEELKNDNNKCNNDDKEPNKKKHKSDKTQRFGLKTYAKTNIRAENVIKGRPTPNKRDDDLSWIFN